MHIVSIGKKKHRLIINIDIWAEVSGPEMSGQTPGKKFVR